MTKKWREAILANANGIAMEIPMIVLHGPDIDALLKAAYKLVVHAHHDSNDGDGVDGFDVLEKGWGPKDPEDVSLPASEWGAGRRVVVDRRYHFQTGAILVRIPDPTISNTSCKEKEKEDEDGEVIHPGAAHVTRCAGVFEVIKEFAISWGVDMKRRIAILHQACRLPVQYQGALRKLAEDSHASTLFVLTSTKPFSLDHGIHSRAVFVPIPIESMPSPASFDPLGTALRLLSISNTNPFSKKDSYPHVDALDACARVDHSVALVRSLGGDLVAARIAGAKLLTISLGAPKQKQK